MSIIDTGRSPESSDGSTFRLQLQYHKKLVKTVSEHPKELVCSRRTIALKVYSKHLRERQLFTPK